MTTSTPREPWDDDRLGAAFRARAAGTTTPADLVGLTSSAVRTGPVATQWARVLAAAAVVVLAVGAIAGGTALLGNQRGQADATANPTGNPTPSSSSPVDGAMDLPTVTVPEAIAVRDAGADDRELAIRGWFTPFGPVPCPRSIMAATSPVQPVCPDQFIVLTAEPESPGTVESNGYGGDVPVRPSIEIDLDDLSRSWGPSERGAAPAMELVVIGHFDDRRSFACPSEVQQACRDRFVVDRVAMVDGATQPLSLVGVGDGPQKSTAAEIQALVARATPSGSVLSMAVVDGPTGIGRIEPSLGTGRGGFIDQPWVWVVRVLEGDRSVTYVVADGTNDVFRMDPEGAPIPVAATASPSATTTVLGIPVISVPELIAMRTGAPHPSPNEVAVHGWMIRSNVIYDCLLDPDPHPLVPWCQTPTFLMEQPKRPAELTTSGPLVVPLIGPDANVEVGAGNVPVEVIAIGHLGDHRWATCRLSQQDTCRREFVVDRIVAADADVEGLPAPWHIPSTAQWPAGADPSAAVRRLKTMVGAVRVVSVGLAMGASLHGIEPAIKEGAKVDGLIRSPSVWVVRALVATGPDPAVARTFLMPEGTEGPIWEASELGVLPVPEPVGVSWPPDGATVVELTSQVGAGRRPAQVAVDDRSGWMTSVREVRTIDAPIDSAFSGDRHPIFAVGSNGRYHLQWMGSVCDSSMTVTIGESVGRIDIFGGERPGCDAMGIGRELVLTFSKDIDAAATQVTYDVTILPED